MAVWFSENGGTLLVGLILLGIICLVVRNMIRDKKQGKSSCSGGCSSCPMSGSCHQHAAAPGKRKA